MTAMMVGGKPFCGGGGIGGGSLGRGGSLSSPSTTTAAATASTTTRHHHHHHHHHHHRLPPSPNSPGSPESSESPTSPTSPGRAKACGVCGDIAKSMHFGGLSCDSCKAFFRRSVQNNAHRGFTCPYEKKCVIAVTSRKSCQFCRFQKCLSIGMEKGWVMTEEERRKMMQQRQEKKDKEEEKKKMTQIATEERYTLSEEDSTEISIIVSLYKKAYQDVPYQEQTVDSEEDGAKSVMSPWMTFCKRIGYFFSLFREFADLPSSDQALLLKTAITSACIIMGSVVYDSSSGRWPGFTIKRSGYVPNVSMKNVQSLVPAELMSRVEGFFKKFQQVCPDETMAMILILVTLYSPELMGLEAKDTIQALQDRYTRILHKYVGWKYKEQSALMFPKVIVSLADIRELAERTCQMRIKQSVTTNIPSIASLLQKPGPSSSSVATTSAHGLDPETPMETNEHEEEEEEEEVEGAVGGVGMAGQEEGLVVEEEELELEVEIKQECELQSDTALQTEAAHKRARLEATGGLKDHTYQKIMQKIMEMHGSSIHMKEPSILPFIIQIVKKVGAGTRGTEQGKTSSGGKGSRGHKHHHHHKSKRRSIEVKQERIDEDTDTQHHHHHHDDISSPLSTTTTATTTTTTTSSSMSPTIHHQHHHHHLQQHQHQQQHTTTTTPSPPLPTSTTQMSLQYQAQQQVQMETQQQQQQQQQQQHHHHHHHHHHIHLTQSQNHHQQQQQQQQQVIPHNTNTPPPPQPPPQMQQQQQHTYTHTHMYPASPMDSNSGDLISSPHDPLLPSPIHPSSPEMILPHPPTATTPHMVPVAPYTPPSATPSPSIPHKQPTVLPTADMPLPSPVATPSPYSDSSSSSPESLLSPYDLFSEDLSNVEIDVLTQLLDYVSNFGSLDNVNPLKEILPAHLLAELQNKLCTYSLKHE